jgi:hypothetical protein
MRWHSADIQADMIKSVCCEIQVGGSVPEYRIQDNEFRKAAQWHKMTSITILSVAAYILKITASK